MVVQVGERIASIYTCPTDNIMTYLRDERQLVSCNIRGRTIMFHSRRTVETFGADIPEGTVFTFVPISVFKQWRASLTLIQLALMNRYALVSHLVYTYSYLFSLYIYNILTLYDSLQKPIADYGYFRLIKTCRHVLWYIVQRRGG